MKNILDKIIENTIKSTIKEAELSVGEESTKFSIDILVSNPQSETKQGIRIQLRPKEGIMEPDRMEKLSAAIMTKFNNALEQFKLQISVDSDTSDPEAMGFFIPLEHIKNMIEIALKGPSTPAPASNNNVPSSPNNTSPKPPLPPDANVGDDIEEMINEEIINEMLVRELKRISKVVLKEDFYGFINAGNNIIRTLEENGIERPKKYLEYLTKHNIM